MDTMEDVIRELREVRRDVDILSYHAGIELKRKKNGRILVSSSFIIDGVSEYYGVRPEYWMRKYRGKELVARKRMLAKLLKDHTGLTLQKIAATLGLRHHATIIHHLKEANNMLSEEFYGDDDVKREYARLVNYLKL